MEHIDLRWQSNRGPNKLNKSKRRMEYEMENRYKFQLLQIIAIFDLGRIYTPDSNNKLLIFLI